MDKISGILPATARITAVDLRNSGTARSGTPGFGREMGVSTVAAKHAALETAAKASLVHKDQITLRNVESDPKAEIVQRMADKFFINNAKSNDVGDASEMDENMIRVDNSDDNVDTFRADDGRDEDSQELGAVGVNTESSSSDDNDLAVGQYLDVRA